MKKKTKQLIEFITSLHNYIVDSPQYREDTSAKTESQIQTEIRPLIISFVKQYYKNSGYKDPEAKAHRSFYWEGQEGVYGKDRELTFASRNYPDFIITQPYLLAIEYKKSHSGSTIKQGMGQSIMHTISGDFDYVYFLFHDQNDDKRIFKSRNGKKEKKTIELLRNSFNVFLKLS